MILKHYFVQYKTVEYYIWARTADIAYAIAQERFSDEVEIDETGETTWEYDDHV